MSSKKFSYIIVLECPSSGNLKGKIGRTDDLLTRFRQLENSNGMKLVPKRSIYYCADIESELLNETQNYVIGSKTSEYRTIKGVETARRLAKENCHQSFRVTSLMKAHEDRLNKELSKRYEQNKNNEKQEEIKNLKWQQERLTLLEAQTQCLPHPSRTIFNRFDWSASGTVEIEKLELQYPELTERLVRLRRLACRLIQSIVSPHISLYLKPCPLDDSDLFREYKIVYGWMPYDKGYCFGDLAITKALLLYSRYWKDGGSPFHNQTHLICRDFKNFDKIRGSKVLRLSGVVSQCVRVQDELSDRCML